MKTIMIKVVLIGCLFVSIFAKAQNPFITKADIMLNLIYRLIINNCVVNGGERMVCLNLE